MSRIVVPVVFLLAAAACQPQSRRLTNHPFPCQDADSLATRISATDTLAVRQLERQRSDCAAERRDRGTRTRLFVLEAAVGFVLATVLLAGNE